METVWYVAWIIVIQFPDSNAKHQALGKLPRRFSFNSWATGEMMVPAEALAFLAVEGIPFFVEGPASGGKPVA